ncbi:MAG: hypothetical protein LBU28_00980 [Spirochaetaceae bacterium]|nr:hypothetical protein [Spirochaetaceae bacterium]
MDGNHHPDYKKKKYQRRKTELQLGKGITCQRRYQCGQDNRDSGYEYAVENIDIESGEKHLLKITEVQFFGKSPKITGHVIGHGFKSHKQGQHKGKTEQDNKKKR